MADNSNSTGLGTWFRRRQEQEDARKHEREMLEEEREHEREMLELKTRAANQRKLILIGAGFAFLVIMLLGAIAGVTSYFRLTGDGLQGGAAPGTQIEMPAEELQIE